MLISNFFKDYKLHEPVGLVHFEVFKKNLQVAYEHQIALAAMLLFANNLQEKRITESQDGRNFCTSVTTFQSRYYIELVLHEKCTCFQPIRRT